MTGAGTGELQLAASARMPRALNVILIAFIVFMLRMWVNG